VERSKCNCPTVPPHRDPLCPVHGIKHPAHCVNNSEHARAIAEEIANNLVWLEDKSAHEDIMPTIERIVAGHAGEHDDHARYDCEAVAKVWAALGITEYTGKHIAEHVAEIVAERDRMGDDIEKQNDAHYEQVLKSIEQQRQIRELREQLAGYEQHERDLSNENDVLTANAANMTILLIEAANRAAEEIESNLAYFEDKAAQESVVSEIAATITKHLSADGVAELAHLDAVAPHPLGGGGFFTYCPRCGVVKPDDGYKEPCTRAANVPRHQFTPSETPTICVECGYDRWSWIHTDD